MKLAIKSAMLCGTGAFLLATYAAILKNATPERLSDVLRDASSLNLEPFAILGIAIPSALGAGAIGYFLGDILAKPQKKKPAKKTRQKEMVAPVKVSVDETFLSDLDEEPDLALADGDMSVESSDLTGDFPDAEGALPASEEKI